MIGETYLATVYRVYTESDKSIKNDLEKKLVPVYNDNNDFTDTDVRFLGAIEYRRESFINKEDYAFPFDKNNITYPLIGETVLILNIGNSHYWLPYSATQYPNFRESLLVSEVGREKNISTGNSESKNKNYTETKTGSTGQTGTPKKSDEKRYKVNEKIKFLKPRSGDTIISGRVGNTIRFSEFFLTEDGKTSSPGIFIRNKQNPQLDNSKIGTTIDEDINSDGTSVYFTSNKIKVPFKENINKTKVAFKDYPNSEKLTGNQLFVNSDRVILSAKASEFIIFGKGNTGVITDGNYSIDAEREVYIHNRQNITIHSEGANQIFLNSENGKIFLGKNTGAGDAGADVQKMVLGGELIKLMGELIDAINKQIYATPSGPTFQGPSNRFEFDVIKSKLRDILSSNNFLSK
jgi:hypothetical protein